MREKLSVAVIVELSVMARKEKQDMSSSFLVKNEHLGLRVPLGYLFRAGERFFVSSELIAIRIVIEIAAVTVDNENKDVLYRRGRCPSRYHLTGD